ncbi:MAG: deoxyribose-phosphate aldolase [Bacteroidales bacterium]|nr:deoxyribose-phosphate aldolase [Bacteroidales bacterium]
MTKSLYEKLVKQNPSMTEVKRTVGKILSSDDVVKDKHLFMNIFNCIDLTSLNSTDNKSKILQLTGKVNSFQVRYKNIPNVAGICVFPNFVSLVKERLIPKNVKIVSVAASFPYGQTFHDIKVTECMMACNNGADEIDIVLNQGAFFSGDDETVLDEIKGIKDAIGDKTLKVIIESGKMETHDQVFKAAMMAMDAGADFIKTSTGKMGVGATPEAAYLICKAINYFYQDTGIKIGFKAAGGISTVEDAIKYYSIVKYCLGDEWLNNQYFRIGASRLANNILSEIGGERLEHF